jgi:hypothetical protein
VHEANARSAHAPQVHGCRGYLWRAMYCWAGCVLLQTWRHEPMIHRQYDWDRAISATQSAPCAACAMTSGMTERPSVKLPRREVSVAQRQKGGSNSRRPYCASGFFLLPGRVSLVLPALACMTSGACSFNFCSTHARQSSSPVAAKRGRSSSLEPVSRITPLTVAVLILFVLLSKLCNRILIVDQILDFHAVGACVEGMARAGVYTPTAYC